MAVSRFCHSRLPAAITACSLRLRLGGYATANGLKSTSKLLAHLDTALPRLPRVIVVTWLVDSDWRVRLAGLNAFSLYEGDSTGNSADVSAQHCAAIAALQEDLEPAVSAFARSLVARIDPMRLTGPPFRAPKTVLRLSGENYLWDYALSRWAPGWGQVGVVGTWARRL